MQDLEDDGFDAEVQELERKWLESPESAQWFAQEQQLMAIAHQDGNRQVAMVALAAFVIGVLLLGAIVML